MNDMSNAAAISTAPRVTSSRRVATGPSAQRGIALFVGLVFLVMLTMIALVVMKGTLLELRMTTATARHEAAFEASEALRPIPEAVLADHVFNRGWPSSWGGDVPDAMFDLNQTFANRTAWINLLNPNTTSGLGLQGVCGGSTLVSFYLPASACSGQTDAYNYMPGSWAPAVKFTVCETGAPTGCGSNQQVNATISVVRDGVTVNKGAGAAMSQGYASIGVGTAKAGSALLLQIRSEATVPGNGQAATIAQYKLNVAN
ncbi:MAG TPA: PilX N-terminal domain-containing pilus assembly protein [Rhodanobacter sp.]|nr:PilX N-terminal domain-containing pilus assembly protein [Rhodanobacter sp.]